MLDQSDARLRRPEMLWLLGLMLAVIVSRLFALGADPMPELPGAYLVDAGHWWKNARLHALWGAWTLDDSNYGLYLAPAHTVALRAVFGLLGVGMAQANALSAASGIATVLLIHALVRQYASGRAALLAVALAGVNSLVIPYDRSSYPESFQTLLFVVAVAAIIDRRRRFAIAALGGFAATLVVFARHTGLALVPAIGLVWAVSWVGDRKLRLEPKWSSPRFLVYAGCALALLLVIGIGFAMPHWSDIALQRRMANRVDGTPNLFVSLEWGMVLVVACFAAARVARALVRPATQLELACWAWLVCAGVPVGLLAFRPDRRFLVLVPALAILSALALADVDLRDTAWRSPRARRLAGAGAAAILGGAVAFYVIPQWWSIATIVGALIGTTWNGRVRWRVAPRPRLVFALLLVLLAAVQSGRSLASPSYGMRTTAAILARFTRGWTSVDRVVAGWQSATFVMGTNLLGVSQEAKPPRAVERFRPLIEIQVTPPGRAVAPNPFFARADLPARVECVRVPIGRDRVAHLLVEPWHLEACRHAAEMEGVTDGNPR